LLKAVKKEDMKRCVGIHHDIIKWVDEPEAEEVLDRSGEKFCGFCNINYNYLKRKCDMCGDSLTSKVVSDKDKTVYRQKAKNGRKAKKAKSSFDESTWAKSQYVSCDNTGRYSQRYEPLPVIQKNPAAKEAQKFVLTS
jgi:hypothetical protein